MTRRTVSLLVLGLVLALVLWTAPIVLLLVFAGVLLAAALRGAGDWTGRQTKAGPAWGLAIFCLALAGVAVVFVAFAGPVLADQLSQLWAQVPEAFGQLRAMLQKYAWGRQIVDELANVNWLSGGSNVAFAAVSSTFGALGTIVVILFIGVYGAASPGSYTRGMVALFPPSLRPLIRDILHEAGRALREWFGAQLISMSIVGLLTGFGLWALGIPLALILGVLAALLTFIPTIGPILAAVPAVLIALPLGTSTALTVAGLYLGVQTIESYFITPYVQKEAVSLPPALTIAGQLLLGTLFGIIGLAVATPLAAVLLRLGRIFYVGQYLDEEPRAERLSSAGTHA